MNNAIFQEKIRIPFNSPFRLVCQLLANSGRKTMNSAGAFIRKTRIDKNISLRQLAKIVGISPTYLSHIEVDHAPPPGPEKLERIAEALDITSQELIILAGRWSERAAQAMGNRPELRALFELAFAMDQRDIEQLVEEIAERNATPREIGGLF